MIEYYNGLEYPEPMSVFEKTHGSRSIVPSGEKWYLPIPTDRKVWLYVCRLHPGEQQFYRVYALVMGSLGLNSHYWSWYNEPSSKYYALQRRLVVFFIPVAFISMSTYFSLNYKNYEFTILASIFSVIPFTLNLTCKVLTAQTAIYKIAQTNLMDKIHLYNFYIQDFNEDKHHFIKNLLIKIERNIRYVFYSLMSVALICCSSWVFIPVKHNIQNNNSIHNITTRLELGAYFWQPFDFEYNFYGYCASQIITTYCGFVGTLIWVLFDTINLTFIFHLTGHIDILKYDLRMGQIKKFGNEEWETKLKHITTTYAFITKALKEVESAYGLTVACLYGQNLVQGGLLLYQFTSSGSDVAVLLTYGLMIPVFMGMLIVLSIALENVRIKTDDIPNLVYALPWESMSIRNQKLLRSIIFQVQPTLECKAAFNIKTGVQPALNIIKTTFSYYVMIKSRKEM